ncbi:MAG: hypothetical protein ACI8Z1_002952 [Candidatus Azotimanducaceae bacterium]|jgi:hypothetical protein
MSDEKRRYERFAIQSLTLCVARPGIRGMFRVSPSAECLNFSRTGLQFDSPMKLQPGEKLLMDIAVEDISLQDLKAVVVTCEATTSGDWCHGTRFCLEDTKSNVVFRDLLRIEDRLKNLKIFG